MILKAKEAYRQMKEDAERYENILYEMPELGVIITVDEFYDIKVKVLDAPWAKPIAVHKCIPFYTPSGKLYDVVEEQFDGKYAVFGDDYNPVGGMYMEELYESKSVLHDGEYYVELTYTGHMEEVFATNGDGELFDSPYEYIIDVNKKLQ